MTKRRRSKVLTAITTVRMAFGLQRNIATGIKPNTVHVVKGITIAVQHPAYRRTVTTTAHTASITTMDTALTNGYRVFRHLAALTRFRRMAESHTTTACIVTWIARSTNIQSMVDVSCIGPTAAMTLGSVACRNSDPLLSSTGLHAIITVWTAYFSALTDTAIDTEIREVAPIIIMAQLKSRIR